MNETIYNWNEVMNTETPYLETKSLDSRDYMSFLLKHSLPGKWLDVGCGIGNFVECCNIYGIDCIGVEGHESAKEIAKKRFPTIHIDIHDITKGLPYEDNTFSGIFCNQVIEHIPRELTLFVFREMFRVLKEDGIAFVNMPSIFNKIQVQEPSHINCMSTSSLINYLKDAGFCEIYPTVYPKYLFGNNFISKALSGIIFFVFPFDFLTTNTAAIAIKKSNDSIKVHSKRKYYIDKMMKW